MDFLPKDPAILVSSVNMLLRDEEFDSLESLCYAFSREPAEVKEYLLANGFVYSEQQRQFRPIGFDDQSDGSIPKDSIETAYSFLHQKRNVYIHSKLDWQRDDIEFAISNYADEMNPKLFEAISEGHSDFLHEHQYFQKDITLAVERLERMMNQE